MKRCNSWEERGETRPISLLHSQDNKDSGVVVTVHEVGTYVRISTWNYVSKYLMKLIDKILTGLSLNEFFVLLCSVLQSA